MTGSKNNKYKNDVEGIMLMKHVHAFAALGLLAAFSGSAMADTPLLTSSASGSASGDCKALKNEATLSFAKLKTSLGTVLSQDNGGLGFPMWLTLVDSSGTVCAVVNSLTGSESVTTDIWLGSRNISAQKANAANAFSTGKLALSTANLYSATQPGGSLFGLQASNPVDGSIAYGGDVKKFGTVNDPLVGKRMGGINVFGGGLALYKGGKKIGAIGVSGDTSCTDHVVAWKVREATGFGTVPVNGSFDKMIQDITVNPAGGTGVSASGFGHPTCLNNPTPANAGGSIVF
jgi:uncharacterized protein GlcG (DUF336 family)